VRRLLAIPAVLLLLLTSAAATGAPAPAPPRASGAVVGATVAVSGEPASAPAAVAAEPVAAADRPVARAAASASVAIRDFSFGPGAITVHVGDTVTWANAGPTDHTATADDGAFDTGTLRAGQSGSHTFAGAGTFAYHCTLHPSMRGTVQVVATSAPAPPAGSTTVTPTPSGTAQPATGPTLPNTGLDAQSLAALGALTLLSGLLLRARTRER
jgi:LPXTG-motif cell wall-anchored protein